MKPTKNKKRIDPRYFLEETRLEEEISPGMSAAAEQSAWDLYAQDKGGKPDFPHPKGEEAGEAACKKRNKNRQARGRDPQTC